MTTNSGNGSNGGGSSGNGSSGNGGGQSAGSSSSGWHWRRGGQSTLESLISVAGRGETLRDAQSPVAPWEQGQVLQIHTSGGARSEEKHRITIVPHNYVSLVTKNTNVDVENDYRIIVDGGMSVKIPATPLPGGSEDDGNGNGASGNGAPGGGVPGGGGPGGNAPGGNAPGGDNAPGDDNVVPAPPPLSLGLDKLVVKGNADYTFGERKTTVGGGGAVHRHWTGPMVRMAGMEGVICGGLYIRVITGPSMTVAALASGDVYGGAARASGARVHAAVFNYRSAEGAAWACGAYVRAAQFTIVPAIGSPSQGKPASRLGMKIAKLLIMSNPVTEILFGVLQLLILPFLLIWKTIQWVRGIKKPPLPAGPPRTLQRTAGMIIKSQSTEIEI